MPSQSVYSAEYELFPRVVPEGWSGHLVLDGEFEHTRFLPGVEYTYELKSTFFSTATERKKVGISGTVEVNEQGRLVIPFAPDVGGEWELTVDAEQVRSRNLPCRLGLFVQSKEWFSLRPYIGELHCHSTGSDGGQEPAYVPVRGRAFGMDFLALTDHRDFGSALVMKERMTDILGRRMVLMAGEELHPEPGDVTHDEQPPVHSHTYHYVSVGQRESVRDACLADAARDAAIQEIESALRSNCVAPDLDVRGYAEGVWKVRMARQLGGTTIYCHPYWGGKPINLDLAAIEQTFRDGEAHCVEAISRADLSNYMANKLIELAADGIRWSLVGVSDGHSWNADTTFGQCTLVMTEELSEEGILAAVREGRCVACAPGKIDQFLGPMDLIGFATFYFSSLLPLKRRYMSLQADLGFSYLRGGPFYQELVNALDRSLEDLEARLWAR